MKLNVIHFFSYGENQIISDTVNFKAPIGDFKKAQAVIDDVKSLKPADVVSADYHSINVFGDLAVKYIAKSNGIGNHENNGSFSVEFSKLNQTKLNALIAEFEALKAASDAANPA